MRFAKILVALEYDRDSRSILQRARLAAQQADDSGPPELCLFVADHSDALDRTYPFDPQALEHAREGFLNARRKWLEKQAQSLSQQGFKVSTSIVWARRRYVALLEEAQRLEADLILKTTHPHSTLGRTFLAPGDWHLIREARVPLWLVKEAAWDDPVRVAACVDPLHEDEEEGGTGRDRRLLALAQEMALGLPGELHVIHAYEPMPTGLLVEFDALFAENDRIREEVQERHSQAFDRLLEGRVDPSARRHLEEGPAARVIPDVVKREGIDLVVMGAVARSGLERLLIGSTAEEVLDALDADLLILK